MIDRMRIDWRAKERRRVFSSSSVQGYNRVLNRNSTGLRSNTREGEMRDVFVFERESADLVVGVTIQKFLRIYQHSGTWRRQDSLRVESDRGYYISTIVRFSKSIEQYCATIRDAIF